MNKLHLKGHWWAQVGDGSGFQYCVDSHRRHTILHPCWLNEWSTSTVDTVDIQVVRWMHLWRFGARNHVLNNECVPRNVIVCIISFVIFLLHTACFLAMNECKRPSSEVTQAITRKQFSFKNVVCRHNLWIDSLKLLFSCVTFVADIPSKAVWLVIVGNVAFNLMWNTLPKRWMYVLSV